MLTSQRRFSQSRVGYAVVTNNPEVSVLTEQRSIAPSYIIYYGLGLMFRQLGPQQLRLH